MTGALNTCSQYSSVRYTDGDDLQATLIYNKSGKLDTSGVTLSSDIHVCCVILCLALEKALLARWTRCAYGKL